MARKKSERTKPKLIIKFEEVEVSHEEQMKTVFQFFELMLEGYQDMELRGEKLDEDTKKKVDRAMPLLPVIKRVIKDYEKKEYE